MPITIHPHSSGSAKELYRGTLTYEQQLRMMSEIRAIVDEAPFYTPVTPRGGQMRLAITGAGWGWTSSEGRGYRYERVHPTTGRQLPAIPPAILRLALHYGLEADSLLINRYQGESASLGFHVDKDERDLTAPIVSISLGCTGLFKVSDPHTCGPMQTLELHSGAVTVMAGRWRSAKHAMDRIIPGTSPHKLLSETRINLTLRKSQ